MKKYRVEPGSKVDLDKWDPEDRSEFDGTKEEARAALANLKEKLAERQEILYAEHKHRVLVVFQAMDTGGKDGAIRHVFMGINPQGLRVANFKAPSTTELDHDYLWRIHKQTPGKGEIVVFNRSHYEDLLIVRVHQLVPEEVWKKRYDQINNFEKLLSEEGTTILKFYLHISAEEQMKRLRARLEEPTKRWKFNPDDLKERQLWNEYMQAYEDVLVKNSTPSAPWYIVPANKKWYRDLVVASVLLEWLKSLKMEYPQPPYDVASALRDLEAVAGEIQK
jgi:PPK2 family polyphosphate:nucleotide phosphotransferase